HARPLEHRQLLRDRGRRDDVRGRGGQDRLGRSFHGQVDAAAGAHRRAAARAREGRQMTNKLWEPSPERIAHANITAFAAEMTGRHGVDVGDYAKLWRWSVDRKEDFWRAMWDYGGVIGTRGERVLADGDRMPGAAWFPDARLNFAQNLLERRRADDDGDALVFWGEDRVQRRLSHAELHALAARVAAALSSHGIVPGDRVAAYMPNMPETI